MNKTHTISRRSILHGLPVAIAAGAIPLAAATLAVSIPDLHRRWRACRESNWCGRSEDDLDANYLAYQRLQSAIVAAEPLTARDVAIQFLVDSDSYESENSAGFVEAMRKLAEA